MISFLLMFHLLASSVTVYVLKKGAFPPLFLRLAEIRRKSDAPRISGTQEHTVLIDLYSVAA